MNESLADRTDRLRQQLQSLLGDDAVATDTETCERFSSDVYSAGQTAALVVSPADRERIPEVIRTITEAGFAVFPRGGGMTYTSGYLPDREEAVVVDTSRLTGIVAVSPENMTITVEAGVTWKTIFETLDPLGLRLPFFGTFSGSKATVGGGLSNGALFMGTARHGTSAEIVIGLEVVTATGKVIRTGQAGFVEGKPFYRNYGPDLTGLFVHDCGALGVKTLVSFRLMEKPAATDFGSFVFDDGLAAARALSAIARSGRAEELYVFDPETNARSLSDSDLKGDARRLLNVVKQSGLRAGASLAAAGRGFIDGNVYSLHFVCANNSKRSVSDDVAACRKLAKAEGGREIANSMPKAARANPFEPLNGILGHYGDRWAALNAKIAHEDAEAVFKATHEIFARHAEAMQANQVTYSQLFIAISNHVFSYEPVMRWHDTWLPLHRSTPEPSHLDKLTEPAPNPAGTALVEQIRQEIVALFRERGAASNQIGRTYPYFDSLQPDTADLVLALKQSLDPDNFMNPGVLGLPKG